jgi:hypothetical protein
MLIGIIIQMMQDGRDPTVISFVRAFDPHEKQKSSTYHRMYISLSTPFIILSRRSKRVRFSCQ